MDPEKSVRSAPGIIGPDVSALCGSDENIKGLYDQLKQKKVLTEEIWQELVNPLIPAEGITEEDIEFFQFHEQKRLQKESGGNLDLKKMDEGRFKKARSEAVYTDQHRFTISIARPGDAAKGKKVNPIQRLKKIVKVTKTERETGKTDKETPQEPIEKRIKLDPGFE